MLGHLRRLFSRQGKDQPELIIHCVRRMALEEALPDDALEELRQRLDKQIPAGHISLCSGCGRVLMHVDDSGTTHFPIRQIVRIEADDMTLISECKSCGALTELAK